MSRREGLASNKECQGNTRGAKGQARLGDQGVAVDDVESALENPTKVPGWKGKWVAWSLQILLLQPPQSERPHPHAPQPGAAAPDRPRPQRARLLQQVPA